MLRLWLPFILFITGSSCLTATKFNVSISNWILDIIGFTNLILFVLCFIENIGIERVKLYSVFVNFVGIFISAVFIQNILACTIVVLTFWLPLASYAAVILYIPLVSEVRIEDNVNKNNSQKQKLLFFLGNAATVTANESKLLTECKITHILELTDGKSRNNPTKVPYSIILNQRMVSDVIGDKSSNDLFAIASQSIDYIRGCQEKNGTLLIHCSIGISLSTKFAIYYLVKEQHVATVSDAYNLIRKSRPIADVSVHDLKELEKELTKTK